MAIAFKSVVVEANGSDTISTSVTFDSSVVNAGVMLRSIDMSYDGSNHPLKRITFDVTNVVVAETKVAFDVSPIIKDKSSGYMSGKVKLVVAAETT